MNTDKKSKIFRILGLIMGIVAVVFIFLSIATSGTHYLPAGLAAVVAGQVFLILARRSKDKE